MAYWTQETGVIRIPPRENPHWPGWVEEDCGCCDGTAWGGDHPHECRSCKGGGTVWRHRASGALAEYPGGPFLGSAEPEPA